jgi:hypothetical protein
MKYLAIFVSFLFVSSFSDAGEPKKIQYQLEPASIMREIESRGVVFRINPA